MTVLFIRPRTTLEVVGSGTELDVREGSATLESLTVPYGVADVSVPLLDPDLDDIDPRDNVRVILTGRDEHAGTERAFNLGVRSRTIDHDAQTVQLELATDEALLQDHKALAESTERPHEASLRAIVDSVLDTVIPGAQLEPGVDADATAYWTLTNHCTNARAESLEGFVQGANVSAWGIDTTSGAQFGQNYIYWRSIGAGESYLYAPSNASASPGEAWIASAYFRGEQAGRTCRLIIHFRDNNDNLIEQAVGENVVMPVAPGWVRVSVSGIAPPGTVRSNLIILQNATAGSQAVGCEGILITKGDELVPFFSGANAADAHYTYKWDALPDAGSSTRTAVVERPPELFTWKPGVSAWDFLAPFTSSAGLRLFCDEARVWRLIEPASFVVPGLITLSGALNITSGHDTIARDDPDVFATGIVVRYVWTDDDEIVHTAYDVAGAPDVVAVIDYARPYPGPGAAAAILARRNGTGRTQAVVAAVNWHATPGMEASISLPGTPRQNGKIASVSFPLGDEPTMQVGTRGLIDIPDGSWAAGTPDVTWATVQGTWDTFTWEGQA